jgi:siroheme synthase (precorrin-2 oxidase/ferrochelatase)
MIEALVKEIIETTSHVKAAAKTEDALTTALTEAFMSSLIPPAPAVSQPSPLEIAVLSAALAPSLAATLAPALADALAPAIVKALNTIVAQRKAGQEAETGEASTGQGEQQQQQQ